MIMCNMCCPSAHNSSHHQDYYIFIRGSQPKPSFATFIGGTSQNMYLYYVYTNMFYDHLNLKSNIPIILFRFFMEIGRNKNTLHFGRFFHHKTLPARAPKVQIQEKGVRPQESQVTLRGKITYSTKREKDTHLQKCWGDM